MSSRLLIVGVDVLLDDEVERGPQEARARAGAGRMPGARAGACAGAATPAVRLDRALPGGPEEGFRAPHFPIK